jgi:hypothetical protein
MPRRSQGTAGPAKKSQFWSNWGPTWSGGSLNSRICHWDGDDQDQEFDGGREGFISQYKPLQMKEIKNRIKKYTQKYTHRELTERFCW